MTNKYVVRRQVACRTMNRESSNVIVERSRWYDIFVLGYPKMHEQVIEWFWRETFICDGTESSTDQCRYKVGRVSLPCPSVRGRCCQFPQHDHYCNYHPNQHNKINIIMLIFFIIISRTIHHHRHHHRHHQHRVFFKYFSYSSGSPLTISPPPPPPSSSSSSSSSFVYRLHNRQGHHHHLATTIIGIICLSSS